MLQQDRSPATQAAAGPNQLNLGRLRSLGAKLARRVTPALPDAPVPGPPRPPTLRLSATALPRHCHGTAPMGSGPHGSSAVAV